MRDRKLVICGLLMVFMKSSVLFGLSGLPPVLCVRLQPEQTVTRVFHLKSPAKSLTLRLLPFSVSPTGSVRVEDLQVYEGNRFEVPFHLEKPYPWTDYFPIKYQVKGVKSPIPYEQMLLQVKEALPVSNPWDEMEDKADPQCLVLIVNAACEKFSFDIRAIEYDRRMGVIIADIRNQSNVPVKPGFLISIFQKKAHLKFLSKKTPVLDFPVTEGVWLFPGLSQKIKIPAVLFPGKYVVSMQVRLTPPFKSGTVAVVESDLSVQESK